MIAWACTYITGKTDRDYVRASISHATELAAEKFQEYYHVNSSYTDGDFRPRQFKLERVP